MKRIEFMPLALQDLTELKAYITEESGSEIPAKKTVEEILKRISMLSAFPEIGRPLSSFLNIDTPYRFLVCKSYHVFYRTDNDVVLIVRVLHNRRNYMQILFGNSQDDE